MINKGLDTTFIHFGIRKDDMEIIKTLCEEQGLGFEWFGENEPGKYEKARRILLKTRTHKIINYDEFRQHLEKIKKEF